MRTTFVISAIGAVLLAAGNAHGSIVALQEATATFSQAGFSVANSIDGFIGPISGWAIDPQEGNQTAVYETVSNTPVGGLTLLTFTLYQVFQPVSNPMHVLGDFRLSATTDNRANFADGLTTGGDVTANWTVLTPFAAVSSGLIDTLTVQPDKSILASGGTPNVAVYTIDALTTLSGITGFRLETLTDPSLPHDGPGRQPTNGNFVLSEITVDAQVVPEQSGATIWLLLGATVSCVLVTRRLKS
jgi:hypothetical protein